MSFWDQDPHRTNSSKPQTKFASDVLGVDIPMNELNEITILNWLWQLDIDGLRTTDFALAVENASFNEYELITNKQKKSCSSAESISASLLQYEPFIYQILNTKVETNLQYKIFELLIETYNPAVNEREILSREKLSLISIFLDSLLQTEVMKLAFLYIKHKLGYRYFNYQRFKGTLFYIWFALHTLIVVDPTVKRNQTPVPKENGSTSTPPGSSRPGSASSTGSRRDKQIAKVQYSSAFEHIFVGEIQLDKPSPSSHGSVHQLPGESSANTTPITSTTNQTSNSTSAANQPQSQGQNTPISSLTLTHPQQPTTTPASLKSPRSMGDLIDLLSPHPNFNPQDLKMADEVLTVEQLVPHLFSKTLGAEFLDQNQYVQSFLTDLSYTFLDSDSSDESDNDQDGESNSNHHYLARQKKNKSIPKTSPKGSTNMSSNNTSSSDFLDSPEIGDSGSDTDYSDLGEEQDYQEFRKTYNQHHNEFLARIKEANLITPASGASSASPIDPIDAIGGDTTPIRLIPLPMPTVSLESTNPTSISSKRPHSRSPAHHANASPAYVNQHPNDQGLNLVDDFKLYVQKEEQKAKEDREEAQREEEQKAAEERRKQQQQQQQQEQNRGQNGEANSNNKSVPILDEKRLEADLYAGLTPEQLERRRKEQVWAQRAAKKAAKQAAAREKTQRPGRPRSSDTARQERFLKRQEKIQRKYNQSVLHKQRTNGVVLGLHFWYTYALLERTRSISYLGHKFNKNSLTKLDAPFISLRFLWQIGNQVFLKDRGSFFVGCSPAFLFAFSTVSFFEVQSVTDLGHYNANRYDLDYEYDNTTQMNINRKHYHQQLQSMKYTSSSRVPSSVFTTKQEFVEYTGPKTLHSQPPQSKQQRDQTNKSHQDHQARSSKHHRRPNSDDESGTDEDVLDRLNSKKLHHLTAVLNELDTPNTTLSRNSPAFYPHSNNSSHQVHFSAPNLNAKHDTHSPDANSATKPHGDRNQQQTKTDGEESPFSEDNESHNGNGGDGDDGQDNNGIDGKSNNNSDDGGEPNHNQQRTAKGRKKAPVYSDSDAGSDYDSTATHPSQAHRNKKDGDNAKAKGSNRALQRQFQDEQHQKRRGRSGSSPAANRPISSDHDHINNKNNISSNHNPNRSSRNSSPQPRSSSRDKSPYGRTRYKQNNSNNKHLTQQQLEELEIQQEMEHRQYQLDEQRIHQQPQIYDRDAQLGGGERTQIGLGWAVLPSLCSNFITRRVIDGFVYEIIVCKEKDFLVSVYNNLIGKADGNGNPE